MALGGGSWLAQNKILPGSYINFASLAKASATLSDRGIAAAPFILSWGKEGAVIEVTAADFQKNSRSIFGYNYDAPEMLALREIFCNATKVYCYRLGTSTKASNTFAEAKYGGARGNSLTIKITADVDNAGYFIVSTLLDGIAVDEQRAKTATELISNDFVTFKTSGVTLAANAGTPLTGGSDCASITGSHYQAFLDAIESYSFNTLCCPVNPSDTSTKSTVALFVNFTKRMREEVGAKFQLCAIKPEADSEGVIGVWNAATSDGTATDALVYWVTGAQAAVAVNKSLTNSKYNGELVIDTNYTQAALESAIKAGKFMFHNVNGDIRILEDINTLVTFTEEKGEIFRSNQTIRVCDQIANDVAVLFNTRYVGIVPNDASGRASLWNDVVMTIRQLEDLRAVEKFDADTVSVDVGERKGSVLLTVDGLNIVNAMSQLYMSVIIQ